jgi:YidC/Oxa1 family membrane protein insertase
MDWIRNILIAGIVIVGLLLANQWADFKKNYTPISTGQQSTEIPTKQTVLADPSSDLPTALPSSSSGDPEELPTAIVEQDEEVPAANSQFQAEQNSDDIIQVKTDVLVVDLDLHGGDIVGVALPQQRAKLDSDESFVLLENNSYRTYIAKSGIIGPNGTDVATDRPIFTSESNQYELDSGEQELSIDLKTVQTDGTEITKRFTFIRGEHLIKISYLINNQSSDNWKGTFYAQLKRDSSKDPGADDTGMGMRPFLGVASRTDEKPYIKVAFGDLAEEPINHKVDGGWMAIVQHYFISAWIPAAPGQYLYTTKVTSKGDNLISFTGPNLSLAPGESGQFGALFYAGPKDQYRLKEIAPGLDLTVDYGWLWWIAQPLFWVLTKIHNIVGNWGWSIIFLTILVKGMFFPLSAASYRSMARMRTVAPKMAQIRELHADDKQKQSQEMMALYKKEKVNPLGGCLPILIQMPVFIALYWVLMESVELRHAPWLGWINDLSSMDPYFILPLIMGASMFFQQKLNPPPPDPMQAKIMQFMPIMFTFFFLWFPSGLVLYWVVNNLLSISQQWVITRRIEEASKNGKAA